MMKIKNPFKRTIVIDCANCDIVERTIDQLKQQQKDSDKKQLELLNSLVNTVSGLSKNISDEVKEDNKRLLNEFKKELNDVKTIVEDHEKRLKELEKKKLKIS